MSPTPHATSESGNAKILIFVAVLFVLVGAIALYASFHGGSKHKNDELEDHGYSASASAHGEEKASGEKHAEAEPAADKEHKEEKAGGDEALKTVIKPGNPVVAKVGGADVNRMDVFSYIQTLPPNTRQLPIEQLFPVALDQVITAKLVEEKAKGVSLDDDEEVKKQLELAKENIVRNVFLQKEVEKQISEGRLEKAYKEYKKDFPEIEEAKARHILVKDEAKAKELVAKLEAGGDFATLAKENSIDGTAQNGGELGYFAKTDVVPEFGEAAYKLGVNEYTKEPVKTDFGYHVIQLLEKRQRPPASFEEIKPFLEAQLRREILESTLEDWRKDAKIERFDINGDAVQPAAGD